MGTRVAKGWLLAVLLGALSGPAWPVSYTSVYFFGDSLADAGNNAILADVLVPVLPPGTLRTPTPLPAPDFVPFFPYASNRYSNGPVWTEQFAARIGASATPFLAGGTNYAFGGARMGPVGAGLPPSVLDQVGLFLDSRGGQAPGDALYVIEAGANEARDATQAVLQGLDAGTLMASYLRNTVTAIVALENAGAHDILFTNIPDIGKTPEYLARGPDAASVATVVASVMNDVFGTYAAGVLTGVRTFDVFGWMDRVIAAPGAYGFTDVTSACAYTPSCIADPGRTFFWDGVHPTTAGHAVMATAALASINPEPGVIVLFTVGLFAVAARRRYGR